ncbi:nitronate monooxygenase [Amycolatopsis mongoliensis]|uniref:Nitronate monooxygenase n=1 Tax=Amycolatopsis mongoliensis TaxID=715475 RepID=A0A9Y2JJN7_9PSEU|nr:nitronate monooxygenase [Amycolatopsis sp. 4-36]WIX98511.1 nitronate monooxygenase [Amycolatopsis sp. 4-36]
MSTDDSGTPRIIQGGMGVAISSWPLARAVSRTGQLGVVSGTALEIVCARRLQQGDPGGHVRRALERFPLPGAAERILRTFYVPAGKAPAAGYRPVPRFTLNPANALRELTVAANFVEVFLAKENHDGLIGINYLRKIELPIPFACYGAMLAGVDHVLMGAGNPADLPLILSRLARHEPVSLPVRVQGATSADGDFAVHFDPRDLAIEDRPELRRPRFDAIVASVDLATGLAGDPATRPDGFVVEGYTAGGHNAPPRGPRRLDELGQPRYDDRDVVEPREMAGIGLPFWMAGSYGTPAGLARAVAGGAAGVQVGTAFALCRESGMDDDYKYRLLEQAARGQVDVRTDGRDSPTGFPFKVAQLAGTLSDEQVYADRQRVCDLGVLRSAYRKPDGTIGYRCPSEPTAVYERHGGRLANTVGRRCLCNALLATAGFAQQRPGGYREPAIVTTGVDYTAVRDLLARVPAGERTYTAQDVVTYLLGD